MISQTDGPSRFEGLSPAQQAELSEVLDQYIQSLEQGRTPDRAALLARYPHLASALETYLESLDYLQAAAAGFAPLDSAGMNEHSDDGPVPLTRATEFMHGSERTANEPGLDDGTSIWPTQRKQLGDFEMLRELGRGGMGVVYEARQISLDRRVALKVLPFAALLDAKQITRFQNEARAAAQLHHPHIVPVFAVGTDRGAHYYAMQLIEGQALDRAIVDLRQAAKKPAASQSGRDTARSLLTATSHRAPEYFRTIARLGIQAAEALQAAHEEGIIHRDIKPSNLLLDPQGHLWVTDFGLARCRSDRPLTRTGDFVGTMGYMSPEQMRGKAELVDHRTDLYSLGITLYELLTLHSAIRARDATAIMQELASEEPISPRAWNASIPLDLETIVLKAVSKQREERYDSAQEMADDLRRFIEGQPTLARRPTLLDRLAKWTRRHKRAVATAAGVMLLAVLGLSISNLLLAHQKGRTEQALRQSQENFHSYRSQLALMNHHLALLQDQHGDSERAEATLRQARQIQNEMLKERPSDQQTLRDLASTLNNLSFMYARHNWAEATQCLEQALGIQQRLAATAPQSAEFQSDLALAHGNLGACYARQGKPDLALAQHRKSIAILESLCKAAHPVPGCTRDLAIAYNNLGMVQSGAGHSPEAEASFQQALLAYQPLLEKADLAADDLSSLGGVDNNLGMVLEQQGRTQEAAAVYARAIERQRAATRQAPQVARFRDFLSKHYYNYGRVMRGLHDDRQALASALARRELARGDAEHLASVAEELALLAREVRRFRLDESLAESSAEQYARLAISTMREAVDLGLDPAQPVQASEAWKSLGDHAEVRAWLAKENTKNQEALTQEAGGKSSVLEATPAEVARPSP